MFMQQILEAYVMSKIMSIQADELRELKYLVYILIVNIVSVCHANKKIIKDFYFNEY